jgi:hypothetical protein
MKAASDSVHTNQHRFPVLNLIGKIMYLIFSIYQKNVLGFTAKERVYLIWEKLYKILVLVVATGPVKIIHISLVLVLNLFNNFI